MEKHVQTNVEVDDLLRMICPFASLTHKQRYQN